eukprot:6484464-Amphidinium_carterae.1
MFQFELGDPVPRVEAHGKKIIIKARWVVARRGKENEWRCRWVCKDFKRHDPDQDGLFTPSSHPSSGFIIDCYAAKTGKLTRIADATNAYWHVPETEEVYAEALEEMKSQRKEQGLEYDIVLLLKKKLYGKRDASVGFSDYMAGHILDLGFERCEDMPCFFRHPAREYVIEVHQDDMHECADLEQLEWFKNEITKKGILFKWSSPIGQNNESYSHLKCKRIRTPTGSWISGNSKYSQAILEKLGLMNAKPCSTPIVSTRSPEEELTAEALSAQNTYRYRKCVGLLRFLRRYRGDLNFAVKELSKALSKPSQHDMARLKKTARYLKGSESLARWFPSLLADSDELFCYVDSDWAGDKMSRQSTSSYMISYGGCNLVDSSKSQVPIATSSGEAEWYGACGGTSEAIFMHKVVEFIFNKKIRLVVFTDSTVCKSIGNRQGCGKIRHLETRSLWLQQWIKSKRLYMRKIDGKLNPADLGTKVLGIQQLQTAIAINGYEWLPEGLKDIDEATVGKKSGETVGMISNGTQEEIEQIIEQLMRLKRQT